MSLVSLVGLRHCNPNRGFRMPQVTPQWAWGYCRRRTQAGRGSIARAESRPSTATMPQLCPSASARREIADAERHELTTKRGQCGPRLEIIIRGSSVRVRPPLFVVQRLSSTRVPRVGSQWTNCGTAPSASRRQKHLCQRPGVLAPVPHHGVAPGHGRRGVPERALHGGLRSAYVHEELRREVAQIVEPHVAGARRLAGPHPVLSEPLISER